ncbi:MAG: hypothetical protein HC811_13165 [Flammeovirgaceae bacterium]|nr:hypothetical protein [Flammeovirgaceae bacterium]
MRSHSIIVMYDLASHKKTVVSQNSRYASASLSPDAHYIATVETDESYQTHLVVLDTVGSVHKKFENSDNAFISMPSWSDDGQFIVALKTKDEKRSIIRYHVESGVAEEILNMNFENAGYPVLHKNYLFYNSPYSGIDNIYVYDLESKQKFQITSSKYGAFNASISPDGSRIVYTDQSRDGLEVVQIPFNPLEWKSMDQVLVPDKPLYQHIVETEGQDLFSTTPVNNFSIKKYSKAKGLINPHTWGPYVNSDFTTLDIGISSKDLLSTTQIGVGVKISEDERKPLYYANVSYQGFYPIIDFSISTGDRKVNEGFFNFPSGQQEIIFDWHENTVEGGLRIPWLLTHSKYHTRFTIGDAMGYTRVDDFVNSVDGGGRYVPFDLNSGYFFRNRVDDGNLVYNRFSIEFLNLLKRSRRDIFSQWGQTFEVEYSNTLGNSDFKGNNLSFLTFLYFPGLAKHHSINGYAAYQKTFIENKIENYIFRNNIPLPRGQSVSRFESMYSYSANYTLPLWYPDIAIGPLVNFQRVRGNVFFDYAFGKTEINNTSKVYTSIGAELKFDVNIMRLLQQFDFGVRYSYPIETGVGQFEFIIGNIGF